MELREVSPLGHDPDKKGVNFTSSHTSLYKNNGQNAFSTPLRGSNQRDTDQGAGKI